jgi:hypothetical protein
VDIDQRGGILQQWRFLVSCISPWRDVYLGTLLPLLTINCQVHHRDAMAFHGMTSLGEIVGPILFGLLFFLVGSGAVKWFLGGIFVIGQLLVMLTLLYANCSPLAQHVKKMKEPGSTFDLEDHPNIGYAPINVDITY